MDQLTSLNFALSETKLSRCKFFIVGPLTIQDYFESMTSPMNTPGDLTGLLRSLVHQHR